MRTTYLWLLQLFTGILILVLVGIHLVSIHLRVIMRFFGVDTARLTAWGLMTNQARQGIWGGLFVCLVAIILFHGFNGLRNTVLELVPSITKVRLITWAIVVGGVILFLSFAGLPVFLHSN
jgi:succinate dehydrogenase hydrophobic anchor subunit